MKPEEIVAQRTSARERLLELLRECLGSSAFPKFDEALTHPSYANEEQVPDNQTLEFLGDAVLGLCTSELLVEQFPAADEGQLTRMRSALVNASALAEWARSIDLGSALAFGKGAYLAERDRTNVLADGVEALVACVYLACGIKGARSLTAYVVREKLKRLNTEATLDPKSALQERVQAEGQPAPKYKVLAAVGPQHDATFTVEVSVGETVLCEGVGKSKRLAEQDAARKGLAEWDRTKIAADETTG